MADLQMGRAHTGKRLIEGCSASLDQGRSPWDSAVRSARREVRQAIPSLQLAALQAITMYLADQRSEAHALLLRALPIAEPQDYVCSFLDDDAAIARSPTLGKKMNEWSAPEVNRYAERLREVFTLERGGSESFSGRGLARLPRPCSLGTEA